MHVRLTFVLDLAAFAPELVSQISFKWYPHQFLSEAQMRINQIYFAFCKEKVINMFLFDGDTCDKEKKEK